MNVYAQIWLKVLPEFIAIPDCEMIYRCYLNTEAASTDRAREFSPSLFAECVQHCERTTHQEGYYFRMHTINFGMTKKLRENNTTAVPITVYH